MIVFGFYALTAICVLWVSFVLSYHKSEGIAYRTFAKSLAFQMVWLAYIYFVSNTGITAVTGLPPRIVVFFLVPALSGVILFNSLNITKAVIEKIPLKNIVMIQTFRIAVEILLYLSALKMIIPREATFEGNNFDIVIGITAPVVSYLLVYKKLSVNLFRMWNFAGLATLAIVVGTFMTKLFVPAFQLPNADSMVAQFGRAPFTFLPGYLMPLAVGLTIMSLKKAKSIRNPLS